MIDFPPPSNYDQGMDSATHVQPKNSGLAITSMVMGILSCTLIPLILTIPAIILGIMGLSKIKNHQPHVKGKGMAITGIITGAVGILGSMLLAAIAVPALSAIKANSGNILIVNKAKNVVLGCKVYESDEGKFPQSLSQLYPSIISDKTVLEYQIADGPALQFNYNPNATSYNDILIYTDPLPGNKRVVGYADGRVQIVSSNLPVPDNP